MPLYLRLTLIAVFALAGYQRARWFERRYGRTPWGWRPAVWALTTGISLFLGCLLLAIAERVGRRRAATPPAPPMPPGATPHPAFGRPQT